MNPSFRRVWSALLCVTVVTIVAPRGHAQAIETLSAGTRVRLVLTDSLRQGPVLPARQVIAGTLVRVTVDSVWLRLNGAAPFGVAKATIRSASASRGVSRLRSAIAFGLGLGVSAAALQLVQQGHRDDALGVGITSLGVGIIAGAVSPFEQWRRLRR